MDGPHDEPGCAREDRCGRINNTGDSNVNFTARDINNSNVHFISSHNFSQASDIKRDLVRPLRIKAPVLTIIGSAGFLLTLIGTGASLYSLVFGTIPWPVVTSVGKVIGGAGFGSIVLLVVSLIVLACGVHMSRFKFSSLWRFALERDGQGYLWLTHLSGPCPNCDGTLEVRSGAENGLGYYATCTENPDHSWRFDYKTLPPIGHFS